jgi:hypothetical protein
MLAKPTKEGVMNKQSSIQFTENKEIISRYMDTANTFLKLSSGALALTITLKENIFAFTPGKPISKVMIALWILYLLAIGSSALYQYFAVRFLDSFSRFPGESGMFEWVEKNPGWLYGAMVVFFIFGSAALVIAAAQKIL